METLRKLIPWKKDIDRNHPSWRKLCITWDKIVYSDKIGGSDSSSLEYKEWNPWKDWCQSWEEFQSSYGTPPKSERRKAKMFYELSTIAKLTRDRLEEAKTNLEQKNKENQSWRNQNSVLTKKCEELQRELAKIVEIDHVHQNNLEKEVTFRRTLQAQKLFLQFQVDQQEEKLQQVHTKRRELEEKVSSLQCQLVESNKALKCQINIKNDFIIMHGNALRQPVLHPQIEDRHMLKRKAGAGCPSRTKIWRKLLRKYDVPYEEIDDAPYWDLVVLLSKHEDLETGDPL